MASVVEPWPIVWTTEGGPSQWPDEVVAAAVAAATSCLSALAGGRYGVVTYSEGYAPPGSGCLPSPYKSAVDGQWYNGRAGECCRIRLDHIPIREVVSVELFGVAQASDSYVAEGAYLRRVGACWPVGEACDAPAVSVTYKAGLRPTTAAGVALGQLAAEFAKGLVGGPCALPSSVVSVTRGGVTHQLADPAALAAVRRTGLPLVDAWVDSVNPKRLQGRSRITSPDAGARVL